MTTRHSSAKNTQTHHDTLFLSPQDVATLISRQGMHKTLADMATYIGEDFLRWESFDKTARVASYSPTGAIELMPIADATTYTFKYVNGHPGNTALGLSTVAAFGVLADVPTGLPLLISELTLTTALRTAATSAVAARALARPDSRVMALIGNGAQSEFQALAFHHLLGIQEIQLYDTDPAATAKLMRNLQANPDCTGLVLRACTSMGQALQGADIVTTITATQGKVALFTADMLQPGTHLNAVGGDCPGKTEIDPSVLHAAKVFIEYEPQTRVEGELQQMAADFAVTALWQVLAGTKTGRDSAAQITMFDSVGFAMEDFSALRYLYTQAKALQLGSALPLIAHLADPKDLYQLVKPAAVAAPVPAPARAKEPALT